ncbi:hypothetical protein [Ectobacillus sp. sgz5001026]|uniref:hypothetical protein n=1 Tax=Ectobacillus sp. sgz5001026 TaxID=3242473 RepID=UPI0036D3BDB0
MAKKLGDGLNGWLKPDGTFYECEYGKHKELAKSLNHNSKSDNEGSIMNGLI